MASIQNILAPIAIFIEKKKLSTERPILHENLISASQLHPHMLNQSARLIPIAEIGSLYLPCCVDVAIIVPMSTLTSVNRDVADNL